ncbi:glycosyltransferase [Pedobacter alpinus]|uniref:Glycosyltransferase n=1 Tax=Pedobacter alpinus TaxID=1590643 RepID=A0ABW5TQC0_9SPHI
MEIYIGYVFFILLQVCFIAQLYFLFFVQRKFTFFSPNSNNNLGDKPAVSVIICARNEANNLKEYLPFVLEQNYPNFEVIVVNDCSYDRSEEVLRDFELKYPHLKVVKIEEHPRFKTAKKFAATLGIKAAKNEILLFTDADCKPASENWIDLMVANYNNPEVEIVLGFSPYNKYRGFLNALIRYETFQTALNYLSFAISGMPYMGVGRNLSYKKSLFFKGKGFASHMHITSGDDDLFVNQNATKNNTVIEINNNTFTNSEPKRTWLKYWKQKTRHVSASKMYKREHRFKLTLQALSALGFYSFFILSLIFKVAFEAVLAVFVLRFACQLFVFYKPMEKLKNKDLLWWFLILDPFYYIYLIALNIAGIFIKKTIWK